MTVNKRCYLLITLFFFPLLIYGDTTPPTDRVHGDSAKKQNISSPPVSIVALPDFEEKFYFTRGDEVKFEITVEGNSTKHKIKRLELDLSSTWLKWDRMENGNKISADSCNQNADICQLIGEELSINQTIGANITYIVKDNVHPLASLFLSIDVNVIFSSNTINPYHFNQTSSPVVYSVFPDINMTKEHSNSVSIYDSLKFDVSIGLCELDTPQYIEITSVLDDYGFMEIYNLSMTKSNKLVGKESYFSHHGTSENTLAMVDFGNLTNVNTWSSQERLIKIEFNVKMNDHPKVENGSLHYIAAGLKSGPYVYSMAKEGINITKDEPALEVKANPSIKEETNLYIGDKIEIRCTITHSTTSTADAKNLKLYIIHENTITFFRSSVKNKKVNETVEQVISGDDSEYLRTTLQSEDSLSINISIQVLNNIFPLMKIPIDLLLIYENKNGIQKREVKYHIPPYTIAHPEIDFSTTDGSDEISSGMKKSFQFTVSMARLRARYYLELVLPKVDGFPLMYFTSFNLVSAGKDITNWNKSAQPIYQSLTNYTDMKDQIIFDLGTPISNSTSAGNSENDRIVVNFDAVVNEHENTTKNDSILTFYAGLISKPKLVSLGELNLTVKAPKDPKPKLYILYEMINSSEDTFSLKMTLNHTDKSQQFAKDIKVQFFLPPYVKFDKILNGSDKFEKINGKAAFEAKGTYYFVSKTLTLEIQVKIDRSKSAKTGRFNFTIPAKLTYYNNASRKFQFLRILSRSLKVLPRYKLIPYHPKKSQDYYSRGIYWDEKNKQIHVCMNQHMNSYQYACYFSKDYGVRWIAHDHSLGCVLGRDEEGYIHGIHRNQVVHLRYDPSYDEYVAYHPLLSKDQQNLRDLTDAAYIELTKDTVIDNKHIITTKDGMQFAGSGDGMYFRENKTESWEERALWWHPKN